MLHVRLGPFPQLVELLLLVHLHADHHAVRLPLGAHIVVVDVEDICLVGAYLVIDALAVLAAVSTVEQLVPQPVQAFVDLRLAIAGFDKEVAVGVGIVGSLRGQHGSRALLHLVLQRKGDVVHVGVVRAVVGLQVQLHLGSCGVAQQHLAVGIFRVGLGDVEGEVAYFLTVHVESDACSAVVAAGTTHADGIHAVLDREGDGLCGAVAVAVEGHARKG